MIRRYMLLPLLLFTALMAEAQYDVSFSHYWAMEPSFNPATAGKQDRVNIAGSYALQMAGFENNPKTMYLAADMPFLLGRSRHGAGVQLINDNIGMFSHKRLGLQYAPQLHVAGGWLSGGLQITLLSETFDGSNLETPENNSDPVFSTSSVNGTGLDIGAGIYYRHRNWYAGVSALHLNAPTVNLGTTNELEIAATYYLTGGYNIHMRNPFLTIYTSILGRTDGVAWRADVTARLQYAHEKKVIYGGLSYSPTNSVTAMVGGNIHGVHIGYAYEYYTTPGMGFGNGSHYLFAGYQIDLNLTKKGRNLHKSVRIL